MTQMFHDHAAESDNAALLTHLDLDCHANIGNFFDFLKSFSVLLTFLFRFTVSTVKLEGLWPFCPLAAAAALQHTRAVV